MNIDFLWSRETTDEQSAACARVLAATISHAIRDACAPLTSNERTSAGFVDRHARSAIEFMFDVSRKAFEAYAVLVGLDPEAVRLTLVTDNGLQDGGFDDASRRRLRFRLAKMAMENPVYQAYAGSHPPAAPENRHQRGRS